MALWSAQVMVGGDSALARDYMVNTLHFNGVGTFLAAETDVSSIADDLAGIYVGLPGVSTTREVRVRIYNLDDPKPRPIKAEAVRNQGNFPPTGAPREVALCLSFYADRNLPRQRGRIYVPALFLGGSQGGRPSAAQMTVLTDLYTDLTNLGGTDLEWSVYSRMDDVHRQVQHGWVDDEWDTVRSRGLRSTTRQLITAEG